MAGYRSSTAMAATAGRAVARHGTLSKLLGNGSISLYAVNVCNKKLIIIKFIRPSDGDTNLWRLHSVKEEKN